MNNDVLDRLATSFPPPERSLERFHRRRERRERNRRLSAAVLALIVAAAGLFTVVRLFGSPPETAPAGRSGTAPSRTTGPAHTDSGASTPPSPALAGRIPGPLAFSGGGHVYEMDPDGTVHTLTGGSDTRASLVSWTPDGSHLLVSVALLKDPAHPCLCLISAGGKTNRPYDPTHRLNGYAAWSDASFSPAGSRVAFAARGTIYVADLSGGRPKAIARATAVRSYDEPAWSPDGSTIAFIRRQTGGPAEIYAMNPAGEAFRQLTTPGGNGDANLDPAWSPDGSQIAFTHEYGGSSSSDIFTMNADGTGSAPLVRLPSGESRPSWSPDGTQIAFASDGSMDLVGSDGSHLERIPYRGTQVVDAGPVWQPNGG